jgi:UDP-4-amino-4,6-dideoxy-N-acetyl-beta-L-altrosamine transaminase
MGSDDIEAVLESLRSDYLSQGQRLSALEEAVAAYCNAEYCLAVSSGTSGLHLACEAVGLKPGEIAYTTPLTFVATANAARYTGASVDFVDIDPASYNMAPNALAAKFKADSARGKKARAVLPVHFCGQPCDMKSISEIARQHGSYIIEDACHALGGSSDNKPIGSCTDSDITVFSLHPVKSITAGEGGLVTTNSKELYERMKLARSHGLIPDSTGNAPWVAEMAGDGFNYRITEMQCALASNQLLKLDDYIAQRRKLVERYHSRLKNLPVSFQNAKLQESAWHLLAIRFDFEALGITKRHLYDGMRDKGITLAVHYLPVHLHQFYRTLGYEEGQFPNAESYYDSAFSLPLYPSLTTEDVDEICRRLVETIN